MSYPVQEVLAVRYGTLMTSRAETFHDYEHYSEPDAPMRMDYFFWVIRSRDGVVLVDTGFRPEVGERRGRTCLVAPSQALRELGTDPSSVSRVVISHFHYDHVGNLADFPHATLCFQRKEYDYWRDFGAMDTEAARFVEPAELACIETAVREGRAEIIDGDATIAPGIDVRLVAGHTPGQQIVIVHVPDGGRVVLASDALHFSEELERDMPHALVVDLATMRAAYGTLHSLQSEGAVIVAGHDPRVRDSFPVIAEPGAGHVLRISPEAHTAAGSAPQAATAGMRKTASYG